MSELFDGTPEQYENLMIRKQHEERITREQECLERLVLEYLKVTKLEYHHVQSVFNVILNRIYDEVRGK